MMRVILISVIVAVAFANLSCMFADTLRCSDDTEPFTQYRLFMGRSISDGGTVNDADWETFLADTVTPRFPDGLTVIDAYGQWSGSDGNIQREESKVLIILAPTDDTEADNLIKEVANEYKSRFKQESVLKTVGKTCVSF